MTAPEIARGIGGEFQASRVITFLGRLVKQKLVEAFKTGPRREYKLTKSGVDVLETRAIGPIDRIQIELAADSPDSLWVERSEAEDEYKFYARWGNRCASVLVSGKILDSSPLVACQMIAEDLLRAIASLKQGERPWIERSPKQQTATWKN